MKTGKLEKYSSVRHDFNCYQSVAESAVYTKTGLDSKNSLGFFYKALKNVIAEHASLNLVIHGESTESPTLGFPETIDLENHVVWVSGQTTKEEENKLIEKGIGTKYKDIDSIPPWKVMVVPRGDALSVTFFFHHSIGDGTSGKLFLVSLLKSLNQTETNDNETLENVDVDSIVNVPESLSIPPSVEQVIDMPIGYWHLIKIFGAKWGLISKPETWSGGPVPDIVNGEPLPPTNIAKLSISTQEMNKLQKESKIRGTTITALITAIAVASVAKGLPESETSSVISYSIPRNLRPLSTSLNLATRMGVYVASINGAISRTSVTPTTFDPEEAWKISTNIKKYIQETLDQGSTNLDTGLLKYVNNLREFFTSLMGKPRGRSIEMSSLVVSESEVASASGPGGWIMDELFFFQCANLFGAPLCFSSLGYKGGQLNISCVWGTGVVEDKLVDKVLENFKTYIHILVDSIKN